MNSKYNPGGGRKGSNLSANSLRVISSVPFFNRERKLNFKSNHSAISIDYKKEGPHAPVLDEKKERELLSKPLLKPTGSPILIQPGGVAPLDSEQRLKHDAFNADVELCTSLTDKLIDRINEAENCVRYSMDVLSFPIPGIEDIEDCGRINASLIIFVDSFRKFRKFTSGMDFELTEKKEGATHIESLMSTLSTTGSRLVKLSEKLLESFSKFSRLIKSKQKNWHELLRKHCGSSKKTDGLSSLYFDTRVMPPDACIYEHVVFHLNKEIIVFNWTPIHMEILPGISETSPNVEKGLRRSANEGKNNEEGGGSGVDYYDFFSLRKEDQLELLVGILQLAENLLDVSFENSTFAFKKLSDPFIDEVFHKLKTGILDLDIASTFDHFWIINLKSTLKRLSNKLIDLINVAFVIQCKIQILSHNLSQVNRYMRQLLRKRDRKCCPKNCYLGKKVKFDDLMEELEAHKYWELLISIPVKMSTGKVVRSQDIKTFKEYIDAREESVRNGDIHPDYI